MVVVLAFAATLLVAVLVSALAHRSVLSTAVLFLLAGLVLGSGGLNVVRVRPESPLVSTFAELALFSVLFTDGMRVTTDDLRSAALPGRALALGLPITLLLTAALAHFVARQNWSESLLLGAVLSLTDPVFAAAIVGRDESRTACAACSTSRAASTTGWPCRWWSSCLRSSPAARSTAPDWRPSSPAASPSASASRGSPFASSGCPSSAPPRSTNRSTPSPSG